MNSNEQNISITKNGNSKNIDLRESHNKMEKQEYLSIVKNTFVEKFQSLDGLYN
jgi:hypothetical protein